MILVSGASGFLGQRLLPMLCERGDSVIALYHSHLGTYKHPNLSYVQTDLMDSAEVCELMEEYDIHLIIDLAAIINYDQQSDTIDANKMMTRNLVNAAESKVEKYLKLSSIAALGSTQNTNELITENSPWDSKIKHSSYALGKKLSELEVWRAQAEGLQVMVLCPGVILGISDSASLSDSFTRTICKEQKYFTLGRSLYVDVDDVVAAILQCLDQWVDQGKYIIGNQNISFQELLNTASGVLEHEPPKYELKRKYSGLFRVMYNIKTRLQAKKTFVTRENMKNLFAVRNYDTSKFTKQYPHFVYTPLDESFAKFKIQIK